MKRILLSFGLLLLPVSVPPCVSASLDDRLHELGHPTSRHVWVDDARSARKLHLDLRLEIAHAAAADALDRRGDPPPANLALERAVDLLDPDRGAAASPLDE